MDARRFIRAGAAFACGLAVASAAFAQVVAKPEPPAAIRPLIESRCALCHGKHGESASAIYPRLAAQHPDYIAKQLRDFRDGRRKAEPMNEMAQDLTDGQIGELAGWYSSRPAVSRRTLDAEFAGVGRYIFASGNRWSGVPACASCHGAKGYGTQALPRLAGQHPGYLVTQLKEFGKRERTNDNAIMHAVASRLTEMETEAVATYIGGLE